MTGISLSCDLLQKKMADAQKLIETEAFSCLRQSTARFLMEFEAIQACEGHFNLGPVPNQCLQMLITQIAGDVVVASTH